MKKYDTKRLVTLAMMAAIAYAAVALIRIPAVSFLKYEPKDVILVITGFLFGPLDAMIVTLVVSLVEMVTISETGPIGLLMNVISSASFVGVAAAIYHKNRTLKGALVGLGIGGHAALELPDHTDLSRCSALCSGRYADACFPAFQSRKRCTQCGYHVAAV